MVDDRKLFDGFMRLSVVLTGYDKATLYGTGCADDFWRQLRRVMPEDFLRVFCSVVSGIENDPEGVRSFLSSMDWGPVMRNVIRLWYLGIWHPMPEVWRRRYGTSPFDVTKLISARAYKEGLVWDAMGAHPMGAKQQGFGAWAAKPPPPPEV